MRAHPTSSLRGIAIAALPGTIGGLRASRARGRSRRLPGFPIWYPLTVFLLSRALNAAMILVAARHQIVLDYWPAGTIHREAPPTAGYYLDSPTRASPGYFTVITNWDGQWYQRIATGGYRLPSAGSGDTAHTLWTWAFPPLFPATVSALMWFTGLSFGVSATILNTLAGAVAMLILFTLLDRRGGRGLAVAGVPLLCLFPTAPLLQMAYSESLALLLLVLTFWLLQRRSYGLAIVAVLLLSLTRII